MDFPIIDLMDRGACYQKLLDLLHPQGLACPRCAAGDGLHVHRRRPDSPVVDYRCKGCRRVFNVFTGTPWQGTHFSPATILSILRGIAQGTPIAKLARELGLSRPHLLCGCGMRPSLHRLSQPGRGPQGCRGSRGDRGVVA